MAQRGPRPRLADAVMDEAEEAEDVAMRVVQLIRVATADGVVTLDEAHAIHDAALRSVRESRDVVVAAERAAIADALSDNIKRGGLTPYVARRAESAGFRIVALPVDGPQAA